MLSIPKSRRMMLHLQIMAENGTLKMRQAPSPELHEVMARKAEELFHSKIKQQVTGRSPNDYVLIDVDSGDFEVDADELSAAERLQARRPDALVWCRKVGSPYARRYRSYRGGRGP